MPGVLVFVGRRGRTSRSPLQLTDRDLTRSPPPRSGCATKRVMSASMVGFLWTSFAMKDCVGFRPRERHRAVKRQEDAVDPDAAEELVGLGEGFQGARSRWTRACSACR